MFKNLYTNNCDNHNWTQQRSSLDVKTQVQIILERPLTAPPKKEL